METHLHLFTQKLKAEELKTLRSSLWGFLKFFLVVCILMQYCSYFLKYFSTGAAALVKWINLVMFMLGWKGYHSNKLMDVYGYYLLLALLAIEIFIGRKLKFALKKEMVNFQFGEKATDLIQAGSFTSSTNNKNITKTQFMIKMDELEDKNDQNNY
jgi:hypothetical protein